MERGFQPWKYISLPVDELTVVGPSTDSMLFLNDKTGFLQEGGSELYMPVALNQLGEVMPPTDNQQEPIGILFEVFKHHKKLYAKVMTDGIAPLKVLQAVKPGQWVTWQYTDNNNVGLKPIVNQTADVFNRRPIGIAMNGGEKDEYIPVLLKDLPNNCYPIKKA